MSSFKSRARRIAFGDSNENLGGSGSSSRSSSRSSHNSTFSHNVFRHASSGMSSADPSTFLTDKPAHLAPKRTNRVRKLHRSQPFELFVEALEHDGCVIIQDFVDPQIPAQVQSAETTTNTDSLTENDDENRGREQPLDLNALIRESLLIDTLYQRLSTHFLNLETLSWRSKSPQVSTTRPRLFSSATTDLNSSESSVTFHRSDSVLHKQHSAATKYSHQPPRDTSLGLLVPELDSLSSAIPIRVIPGSHLWDDQKPDVTRGVNSIALHAGDAMVLLGSLYHAVGEDIEERPTVSRSSTGSHGSCKEKLLHDMWMCSGVYRSRVDIPIEDEEA